MKKKIEAIEKEIKGMPLEQPKICFVEKKKKKLNGYTLIEGFPGMGLVGTIATKYLTEQLEFEEIGYIESNMFLPVIRIHDGLPVYPSRIYVNKKNKIAVLLSEQIISTKIMNTLSKEVIKWIKAKGISRVISLAGIKTDEKEGEKVYAIACNEKSKKEVKKHKIELIGEGLTTGVTALMLLELRKEGKLTAYSLLANVNLSADYKAAAKLVTELNKVMGLKINIKPLMEEAKKTEKMLVDHLQKLKETQETVEKFGKETPATAMYS